jgi:hypothetical protein
MDKLEVPNIVKKIEQGLCFEAVASDYSFSVKIEEYKPYICAAIHDGHQFRKELWDNCLHTEYDRWYEEDPETITMIHTLPIVLAGRDSRFEYDLNRAPEEAIFETAWGKKLWKKPLNAHEIEISLQKHHNFYTVAHALVNKIEELYGAAIVYDMHSYNWKRWTREVPTWNLGTANIDNERYANSIEAWRKSLGQIKLHHNIKPTADINNTFYGNGYFLKYITKHFKNTLVLATEIAKVYCDEERQVIYPEVVNAVEHQLKEQIKTHAAQFIEQFGHS